MGMPGGEEEEAGEMGEEADEEEEGSGEVALAVEEEGEEAAVGVGIPHPPAQMLHLPHHPSIYPTISITTAPAMIPTQHKHKPIRISEEKRVHRPCCWC